jgi:hypothetical protein
MNASTLSLSSLASSLWADLSALGDRIEVDMKTLTHALCLSNDATGLQSLFDLAFTDASKADKSSRSAITGRFNMLAKRAHYWAGTAGFVLALPRLDGKGDVKVPTITPKETAKLTAQGAAAERAANAERALAEMAQRNAERTASAVAALAPSDIARNILDLCKGANLNPLEIILTLVDSLSDADVYALGDVVNMIWEYRNGSALEAAVSASKVPASKVPASKVPASKAA